MHPNSMLECLKFRDKYVDDETKKSVIDIGSYDVNGNYKVLFEPEHNYVGLGIREGPNVDIVVGEDSYWSPAGKYDVIISGQCLEHVRKPW